MKTQQGAYPITQRASRPVPTQRPRSSPPVEYDDVEEDDSYYTTRPHTSSRRYTSQHPQVIQQGNRRLVIHQEPPRYLRFHWLTYVGIALIIMLAGATLVTYLGTWWQSKQDDWAYGNPRTYQTDVNVGHGTAQIPASHFIAVNLNCIVQVIEDDTNGAHLYAITTLQGGMCDVPVTLTFRDINGDGKLDMLVNIGEPGSTFSIFLFNDGSKFVGKL